MVSFTSQPVYPEGNKIPVPLDWPKVFLNMMEETDSIPYIESSNCPARRMVMFKDSPTPYNELNFEHEEEAASLPINAKCMLDKAVQFGPNDLEDSISTGTIHKTLAAQELNHSFRIQHCPASQPTPNRRSLENEEAIEKVDEIPLAPEVEAKYLHMPEKEISNTPDKTDRNLATEDQKPKESCGVQCLYCIIQCCDCTIL